LLEPQLDIDSSPLPALAGGRVDKPHQGGVSVSMWHPEFACGSGAFSFWRRVAHVPNQGHRSRLVKLGSSM